MPGAWAFLVLWVARYGRDNLHVISRTNRGVKTYKEGGRTIVAWVVRFCLSLGLVLEDNIHVCTETWEKGRIARDMGINWFVDDTPDCLKSVARDGGAGVQGVCYFNDAGRFDRSQLEDHGGPPVALWEASGFFAVARLYGVIDDTLDGQQIWNDLIESGPPAREFDAGQWPILLQTIQRRARRAGIWQYDADSRTVQTGAAASAKARPPSGGWSKAAAKPSTPAAASAAPPPPAAALAAPPPAAASAAPRPAAASAEPPAAASAAGSAMAAVPKVHSDGDVPWLLIETRF